MIITLLCDNPNSWIIPYMEQIYSELINLGHEAYMVYDKEEIKKGELAFFLGCESIISYKLLERNKHNLVVHESDLPEGKGWSPLTWQILEGKNDIPITLFEAVYEVDSGEIYLQEFIHLNGNELSDEIKRKQGEYSKKLIIEYVNNYPNIISRKQEGKGSIYKKRTPKNSELDINKSIKEQFNLLRVVDNKRYPAFFYLNGEKYILQIYREKKE